MANCEFMHLWNSLKCFTECDGQTIDSRRVQFAVFTLETETDNPSRYESGTMFNLDG